MIPQPEPDSTRQMLFKQVGCKASATGFVKAANMFHPTVHPTVPQTPFLPIGEWLCVSSKLVSPTFPPNGSLTNCKHHGLTVHASRNYSHMGDGHLMQESNVIAATCTHCLAVPREPFCCTGCSAWTSTGFCMCEDRNHTRPNPQTTP